MLKAYANNSIIVSAFSNNGHYTYPASFSFVIGVKCDATDRPGEPGYSFHLFPRDGIEITASGTESLFDGEGYRSFGPSNSYAAPRITAMVYNILLENPHWGFADVRYELWKRSKNREAVFPQYFSAAIDWAKQAYCISLADSHQLIKKKKHIPIHLKKIIHLELTDPKTFSEQLKMQMHKDRSILSAVDTVVIINNREKTGLSPYSAVADLQKLKKHIVYLDKPFDPETLPVLSPDYHTRVCCPVRPVSPRTVPQTKEIPVPVAGFFDYTDDKGIALFIRLLRLFRKKGYYALGLSPLETSILYGLISLFKDAESCTPEKSINTCYMLYNPDLIFIHIPVGNNSYKELNKFKFDFYINFMENRTKKHEAIHYTENSVFTTSSLHSKKIYQKIINWFK
jgi:hypothetical protein